MQCPNCQTENPAEYSFCLHCGAELPSPKAAQSETYANPKLEAQRKKRVATLAKLYTRAAIKTKQPNIQRFDPADTSLTPEGLLAKIETPVVEALAAQKPIMRLFWLLLIVAGISLVLSVFLFIWSYEGFMFVIFALVFAALAGVSAVQAFVRGNPNMQPFFPLIAAELARRQAQPEQEEGAPIAR